MRKLFAALLSFSIGTANAAVVSGEIFATEYFYPDTDHWIGGTFSVDFYSFSSSGGLATFDVTANDQLAYGGSGSNNLNDSYIYIFRDDGSFDESDLVTENDDWALGTGGESGSIVDLDSFISINLQAGNYFFAISSCCSDFSYTNLRLEYFEQSPDNQSIVIDDYYDYAGPYTVKTTGTSDLTLTTPTTVPVPAAVWLFGSGLGLLGWMRSKKG